MLCLFPSVTVYPKYTHHRTPTQQQDSNLVQQLQHALLLRRGKSKPKAGLSVHNCIAASQPVACGSSHSCAHRSQLCSQTYACSTTAAAMMLAAAACCSCHGACSCCRASRAEPQVPLLCLLLPPPLPCLLLMLLLPWLQLLTYLAAGSARSTH